MKRWHWPGLLLLTILLAIWALPSQIKVFSGFVSAFASRSTPPLTNGTKPLYQEVYLVVIDGLRYDTAFSSAMPFLGTLIENGAAWGPARAGLPSYSRPAYARLLTGAPAELTGLTMNDQESPAPMPTIFSLAMDAGLRTAASAHRWIRDLAEPRSGGHAAGLMPGERIRQGYFYRDGEEADALVFANARELVRLHDPHLLLILPMQADLAGHAEGGDSPAYRRAAAEIDAFLADFYYSLPDRDFLLIITADHGHTKAGGHGGAERDALTVPLILAGPGVRPGRLPEMVDQLDLAPTVAAALGLPLAGSMGGRLLSEAFADETAWLARQDDLRNVQDAYLAANADLLGGKPRSDGFSSAWREARSAARWRGALWRLFPALALAALAVYTFLYHLRSCGWQWPIFAGLTYPLYYYALLRLLGAGYSYSAIRSPFDYAVRVCAAGILALLILTWAGAALRRGGERFLGPTCLGAWFAQVLSTLATWVVVGGRFRVFLPDPAWQSYFQVQLAVTSLVAFYSLLGLGFERFREGRLFSAIRMIDPKRAKAN